jgi:hypothetical protein
LQVRAGGNTTHDSPVQEENTRLARKRPEGRNL